MENLEGQTLVQFRRGLEGDFALQIESPDNQMTIDQSGAAFLSSYSSSQSGGLTGFSSFDATLFGQPSFEPPGRQLGSREDPSAPGIKPSHLAPLPFEPAKSVRLKKYSIMGGDHLAEYNQLAAELAERTPSSSQYWEDFTGGSWRSSRVTRQILFPFC